MNLASHVDRDDWRPQARCRGMDIAVFYTDREDNRTGSRRQEQQAKAICRQCPVISECRTSAIDFGEQHGIWGGLNPNELRAARKWSRWQR